MERIFDSSPLQALELLASSLHGMLTNPSTPWFTLRFKQIRRYQTMMKPNFG